MRRPSKRALLLTGVGLLLVLLGTTAQAGWLFVLAAGVLSLILVSIVVRHPLSSCELSRSVASMMRVGDETRLHLELSNAGRKPLIFLRIMDRFDAFPEATLSCEEIAPGQKASLDLVRTARLRGRFDGGPMVLSSGYPFGLFTSRRTVEVASPVVVVPRWVELRTFPLLEPSSYPAEALHERARIGAGLDYLGTREYRPGDSPRSIHWRSTARLGRLVVREYEDEGRSRVALVIAGADEGTPPDSAYEALVSAAASIALYALETGHPLELVRAGPSGEIQYLADPDRAAVLSWLAETHPNDVDLLPLVSAATVRLGRRGTAVVLAPTAGRTGAGLGPAVRAAQGSGARAAVVVARSWTWKEQTTSSPPDDGCLPAFGGRTHVRTLSRGEDLQRCLET